MKKILNIIEIICIFFFIYFLQINLFNWFTIYGVMPNIFIILILSIGLFMGEKYGIFFGIFVGFIIDILVGKNIGISSIMYCIIGILGGYIDKNFSKDSRIMIMAMVAISTVIFELGQYSIKYILLSYLEFEIGTLAKIISIEVIYNIIIFLLI